MISTMTTGVIIVLYNHSHSYIMQRPLSTLESLSPNPKSRTIYCIIYIPTYLRLPPRRTLITNGDYSTRDPYNLHMNNSSALTHTPFIILHCETKTYLYGAGGGGREHQYRIVPVGSAGTRGRYPERGSVGGCYDNIL